MTLFVVCTICLSSLLPLSSFRSSYENVENVQSWLARYVKIKRVAADCENDLLVSGKSQVPKSKVKNTKRLITVSSMHLLPNEYQRLNQEL